MEAHSDEDLVGDVDIDFDHDSEFEQKSKKEKLSETKKGRQSSNDKQRKGLSSGNSGQLKKGRVSEAHGEKRKLPAPQAKPPAKKKIIDTSLSDDMVLAFSFQPSVKKTFQTNNGGNNKSKQYIISASNKSNATPRSNKNSNTISNISEMQKNIVKGGEESKSTNVIKDVNKMDVTVCQDPHKQTPDKEKDNSKGGDTKHEESKSTNIKEDMNKTEETLCHKPSETENKIVANLKKGSSSKELTVSSSGVCQTFKAQLDKSEVNKNIKSESQDRNKDKSDQKLNEKEEKGKRIAGSSKETVIGKEMEKAANGAEKSITSILNQGIPLTQKETSTPKSTSDCKIKSGNVSQEVVKTPEKNVTSKNKAVNEKDHVHQQLKKKDELALDKDKPQTGKVSVSIVSPTKSESSSLQQAKIKIVNPKPNEKSDIQGRGNGQIKKSVSGDDQPSKTKLQDSSVKVSKDSQNKNSEDKKNKSSNPLDSPKQKMKEYSEEDYKSMDNFLVEGIVKKLQQEIKSQKCGKYTVHISPLEIADLAHPTIQQLVQLHPSLSMVFQHQAVKLKKKKGYADAVFRTVTDLKEFVYQLTQVKVCERRLDVSIAAADQPGLKMSFTIHLNRNLKLMDLINSGEDPVINKPIHIDQSKHKIQFEKVPSIANAAFMHSLFPFTNNVHITRKCVGDKDNDTEKSKFHGPVFVYYINGKWLDAVMTCCTDFAINDFPLKVMECENKGEESSFSKSEDDSLSRLTQDVYAEVLESISKLKSLTPNNPKLKEILQMQQRLDAFQRSLKSSDKLSESEVFMEHDLEKTEMQRLEEMYEEKEQEEYAREQTRKRKIEKEINERKEIEKKKKNQWARSLISDFKQTGPVGDKRVSKGAEQILQQREKRLKERQEEEIRRKEEELRRKEEEELRRLRIKEEERLKEEEKNRLIQQIEEARRRDMQRAEQLSSSQSIWKAGDYDSSSKGRRNQGRRQTEERVRDDGDGDIEQRLDAFARELKHQSQMEYPSHSQSSSYHSPGRREMNQDAYIIHEQEFEVLKERNHLHTLPPNYKVMMMATGNRYCPATDCPATRYFREFSALMEHWSIFHEPKSTMRFCPNCTAYFMTVDELENHMMKTHRLSSMEAYHKCQIARVKIISNPSFRDPSPFIAPNDIDIL